MVRLWFSIIKYLRAIAAVFKVHDQLTKRYTLPLTQGTGWEVTNWRR